VRSPKLLKGRHPLRKPEDLKHHTLIRDTYPIDWTAWLSSAGVKAVNPGKGLTFDSYTSAIEAAAQGEGWL
jgi:LysR family glycine cleavage system transcriptional activator